MSISIGILGGMGPRTTVQFEQRLLDLLKGTDQDLPTVLTINDGSIPDRSRYLLMAGEDPVPKLIKRAKQLEYLDADIIAMPCNSACAPQILSRLQAQVGVPILNLPALTAQVVENGLSKRTVLLATAGTVSAGTYQSLILGLVVPGARIQRIVDRLITATKTNSASQSLLAQTIREYLDNSGCDSVILGCTELPLVNDLVPDDINVFDTLDILARRTVEYNQHREN